MLNSGKVVFITGASDGLGKALALQLAERYDLRLVLCGRNAEKLRLVEEEIMTLNPNTIITARAFDMLDETALADFVRVAENTHHHIDVLINNAGANVKKNLVEDIDLEDFRYMMELNCTSQLSLIQKIYPKMKEKNAGHIINILSSVCLFPIETMAGYTASKQAMNAVHQILLKEARAYKVKVTGIYPGGIDTNFRELDRPDYMRPTSVAKAIINLLELEDDAIPQELIIRPFVEKNY